MRPFVLNLVTCAATVVIPAALALPAKNVLERPQAERADAEARIACSEHPGRVFGAYVDPWHVDDWARAIGAAPQAIANFEAFLRNRTLRGWAGESRRRGIRRMLVSREPWRPVPAALGLRAQAQPQAGYCNLDIAHGAQGGYFRRFARSLAAFPGTLYVDFVGSTMIDFGGSKDYPVRRFLPRLRTLWERFGKPLVLTETKVVDWDVQREPRSAAELRKIIVDGAR